MESFCFKACFCGRFTVFHKAQGTILRSELHILDIFCHRVFSCGPYHSFSPKKRIKQEDTADVRLPV